MAETVNFKYRAFISYSHADTRWAKWLHRSLEGFHVDKEMVGRKGSMGMVPGALRPVFRDRDDFTAGHALNDQTLAALDGSAVLIVLASPASAKSHYVNEEIRLFRSRHPERPVIPVIVDGRPGAGDRECFAPALRFKLDQVGSVGSELESDILAADVHEEGDGKDLALAKVVARILGVGTDEIVRRAERERRRRLRKWVAGLSGVSIALAGLAVWAEINRREAVLNFRLANVAANSLVYDVARGLRDVEGSRANSVSAILSSAQKALDLLVQSAPDNLDLQQSRAKMLDEFGITYARQGNLPAALDSFNASLAIVERFAAADPGIARWQANCRDLYEKIGDVFLEQGNLPEALDSFKASYVISDRLAKAEPGKAVWQSGLSASYVKIGQVLLAQGNHRAALDSFRASHEILERRLAQADPAHRAQYVHYERDLSDSHGRMGEVLLAQGNHRAALDSFKASHAIVATFAKGDPARQPDLSDSHRWMGDVLRAQGNLAAALESYTAAFAITDRLVQRDPTSASWQRDLSLLHVKIGDVFVEQDIHPAALERFTTALAISDRLARADPGNAGFQRELSVLHDRISQVLVDQGNLSAALESFKASLASHQGLGHVLRAQGNLPAALESFKAALNMAERLAKADPSNAKQQSDLAVSYHQIGDVLRAQGNFPAALESFTTAFAIAERQAKADPSNADGQRGLAMWHGLVASVEASLGERERALGRLRQGRDILARLKERSPELSLDSELAHLDAQISELAQ